MQVGLYCLELYHAGLEGERYVWLVVELMAVPPDAHPTYAGPLSDFNGHVVRDFSHGAHLGR